MTGAAPVPGGRAASCRRDARPPEQENAKGWLPMIVKLVNLEVKPEMRDQFIDATLENQANSQLEAGVVVFDFYQSKENPNTFILYESYYSEAGMESHMTTQHFKKWAAAVADCFTKPRERQYYVDPQKGVCER